MPENKQDRQWEVVVTLEGFLDDSAGEESTCDAGDTGNTSLILRG